MGSRVSCVSETLLIIDGHSMAFRAFYALPAENFTTSTGQCTNAVYGFTTMLIRLLETERPTHVAAAFDVSRHSFRTDEYPEYKGTRDATPEEFIGQVELIRQVLDAMGIVSLTKDGYEADDILATLAHRGARAGQRVLVVSGDRDSFQTVTDSVTVLYPGTGPGDLRRMTPEAVEAKYGVVPSRYPEVAALVGEASDNLPGVPGVGPKTAAQWIAAFDGLDNLLSRADEVRGKRGEALRAHIDDVRRNRRLNRLVTDLDVGVGIDDLRRRPTDVAAVDALFDALEFSSLRSRVRGAAQIGLEEDEAGASAGPAVSSDEVDLVVADSDTDLAAWASDGFEALWIDGVGRAGRARIDLLALGAAGRALVVDPSLLTPEQESALAGLLAETAVTVHDSKGCAHALAAHGWGAPTIGFDVQLGAYLARPDQRSYEIADLVRRYLGEDLDAPRTDGDSDALFDLDAPETGPTPTQLRAGRIATLLMPVRAAVESELAASEELELLLAVEQPVARTLARMEGIGIAVDSAVLDALSDELGADVEAARDAAYAALGHEVNLSSPKQLQHVLFEELGLPTTKRTKTGYTTNAEALEGLWIATSARGGAGHEFLGHLLAHRDRIKLKQMVETLRGAVMDDGRIRTTFSQVAAATGRLASSDPNLQNIPARSPDGMRIREAFVAGPGFEALMSVDYSQIEMRIMAHLSRDAGLIEAFDTGEDLHRTMAAMVFDTPLDAVTGEQRSRIKATSYGLAYGLSAFGLSRQLSIPVPEASALRDRYFERFGGVRDYLESLVEGARRDGYTQTMLGRRRYLPDLRSDNRQRREMAERAALNAPIQGSAADIIKIAMVDVVEALDAAGLSSRVLVQIHDELLVEVAPGEREEVERIVRAKMASPIPLDVPLDVAVGVGRSWKDAAH
ncbi:DNA polymerase I [Actinomyces sp. B33]|uniref:DNA polymerase I n=1 Tax=Actinomyces sp. B33 TaxID=2942131 RepID=UPI00234228A7|nr:DNA polymerase I [Actinomyces sp. B33]MDC4233257.1 DNA polymerase I [Actinomyces sp. B33]